LTRTVNISVRCYQCVDKKTNMKLTEKNYREIINSFSVLDWSPLLELIPKMEKAQKFGKLVTGEKNENGVIVMPYWNENAIVIQFQEIVYNMPIIVSFDWDSWEEGHNILQDKNFDFDTIDIPTKCKLITAIVRNDRFCDGVLISAFESGLILRILKSINNQLGF